MLKQWMSRFENVDLKMEQQRENLWKIKSIATCYNPFAKPT